MKLYVLNDWSKRAIQLSEWNTDELTFKKQFVRIREDPIDIDGGSSFSLNRHKILLWFVKKIDYDLNIEERKS